VNENLEALYERLQDRTDAQLIRGVGTTPARVMLVLGKPTALSTLRVKLDVGIIKAFLNNLTMLYPGICKQLYVTCAIKHQNMSWSSDSASDLMDEWTAAGAPPIVVYAGGAGCIIDQAYESVHWVPSIANTVLNPETSFARWEPVRLAYEQRFPDE
jgi:hypothetical protein